MKQTSGLDYAGAEDFPDALMSQTDPQDRYTLIEGADCLQTDSGIPGASRSGRQDNSFRSQALNIGSCDLIVQDHLYLVSLRANGLNQVVGKGIVVINDKNHGYNLK